MKVMRKAADGSFSCIYASNEPKSVLARDLGDCRDNLRNSRSVFLIVKFKSPRIVQKPHKEV